ncbi:zinc ribbon domain-containing protein [soil metagenome]
MPRYDYHCDTCGKNFEVTQRMSDAPVTDCGCGAKGSVHRLLSSGAGIIFKGSGFYQTDYKNPGGAKEPSGGETKKPDSDSSSNPSTPAPATTSVESKPAASNGGGHGSGCACC